MFQRGRYTTNRLNKKITGALEHEKIMVLRFPLPRLFRGSFGILKGPSRPRIGSHAACALRTNTSGGSPRLVIFIDLFVLRKN